MYKENEKEQIISLKTSSTVNSILRKVVVNKEGTANFANIEGYDIGGKTGTALKSINGVYSDKKINTFVSIFPTTKPKYVLLVILDEPKPAPNYVYEFPNGTHACYLDAPALWHKRLLRFVEALPP